MLRGFGYEQLAPTVVWEDNAACIAIANNPVNCKFTHHIDVQLYFVLDLVRDEGERQQPTLNRSCDAGSRHVASRDLPGSGQMRFKTWLDQAL
eukprot:1808243-Rhodomonas_salina.1